MHKSNSKVQQEVENFVFPLMQQQLGCDLRQNPVLRLSQGVQVIPDFYSANDCIIGEIYAHMGIPNSGQKGKISKDLLKMLLVQNTFGMEYRKILVIVDDVLARYLQGSSWLAQSIRQFGFEVIQVHIPDALQQEIIQAQKRQKME